MSTEISPNILSKEKNSNEIIEEMNMIDDLDENCDIEKLKDINVKSVDLIFEDKPQKSLDILKKLENFLENKVIDIKANINKKLLIIILHNISCCYQKLKDYDNCINYLEAVIYHFDKLIEQKHNIKINEEYFDNLIKTPNYKYNSDLLGDLILELRFCAKFHLQMGVALSESKRDIESLKHIKLAALICEDNLLKTTYLYNQLKDSLLNIDDNNNNKDNNEILSIRQQIKLNYKIIFELNKRIMNLRNNNNFINNKANCVNESKSKKNMKTIYNNNYIYIKNVITKIVKNSSSKSKLEFLPNYFKSYLTYRKCEIDNYLENNTTINDIKTIFENNFNQKDDWIKLLNIDNIMYLSALNYDDLDLESDPKYELLRDSILEKVIMLSVAYFCLATELRHLSKDKYNKKTNGEYYLFNAINLAILFLPVSCPIIRHFILTYHKHYGQGMDIIPEGEVIDYKIEIIKKEIDPDSDGENGNNENKDSEKKDKFIWQDFLYFARTQKVNRIIREENNNNTKKKINNHNFNTENNDIYRSKSNSNRKELLSNDYFNNYYTTKKRRHKEPHKSVDEKNISNNHIIRSAHCKLNKNDLEILNISDNNLLNKKNIIIKDLNINYDKKNNINLNSQTSSNLSLNSDIKDSNNKNANISNGHFGLIPNNNFIERVKKSKISDTKAPKFKLNFNNINLNNNFYDSQNLNNNCNNNSSHMVKQISSDKKNKRYQDYENKNEINSDRKRHISKINIMNKFTNKTSINIQFNHNCKTNTKINININKIDKKINKNKNYNNNSINNNSKSHKFQIKKINNRNSGYKTERPHLKGVNNTSTQKKIVYKKNNKIQNTNINKKLANKKYENSLYIDKGNNINSFSNISKYFNIKNSNILEKEYLTDRFIVKINNKLKEKRNKMHGKTKCNSNSPSVHKESNNNQIYRNYMRKKKKEKNPIKLVQNNLTKDDTTKYSVLSDNQKNNQSNGNNNSNIRNFYSNDSNIEDFSSGQKNLIKLKCVSQPEEKNNCKTRNGKDRINKYLKNINLLKKLMNNNNKNSAGDRTFNKEMSNQNKLQKPVKKVKFLPSNNIKAC